MNKKKICKFCYNKGFFTIMRGADIAMPDFGGEPKIIKPQRIEKIPCRKCNKWREMVTDKYFKSFNK